MFAAEMVQDVAVVAIQRSPGLVLKVTIAGIEALVPRTAQAVFTVVDNLIPTKAGASVELATDGIPKYASLIVGVPPPIIESETG